MTDLKKVFQSKIVVKILCGIGIAIVALLIFQAGVFVGYYKAAFSYRWGDNYLSMFGGHRKGSFMGMGRDEDFPAAHGTIGKIIKIDLSTLVIEAQDKTERVVAINDDTIIRRFRDTIKTSDLKTDDYVVVIGSPNDKSQIEAKLIRLMPAPQEMMGTGTPMMRY